MKTHSPSIRNHDLLYSLYVEQNLSSIEIGRRLSIDGRLIRTWLAKFGIPLRDQREAANISAFRYLKKKTVTKCFVCGKEFEAFLYRIKRNKKNYCSRVCQIKDHDESLTKATMKYRNDHPRRDKVCPVCSISFTVPFSEQRRKYCSDRCKGVAQMLSLAGTKGPNKIEGKILDLILNNSLNFKYNGNGELGVVLGGMIPDFVNVNGKKQVIEVFGDYYHGTLERKWRQSELGRIMAYNSLGYKCLILWEHDINNKKPEELVSVLSNFTKSRKG
jgi:very-short-patch-repair endonuclease